MADKSSMSDAAYRESRRDFLKTSTALAAGAAMAGSLLSVPAVHAAGDETIKIALVGCGGRGSGACSQALSTSGPTRLIAVADAFEDNARAGLKNLKAAHGEKVAVAEDHIFHGFDAYKQAVDCGPDLVILATPPGFRSYHFEYAVKQGKNVFAEKPVATDPAGIRRFLAAAAEAKKKDLKVGIGLQRHHDPRYIETIKRIWDGEIGDLILTRAYWNDAGVWTRPRAKYLKEKPDLTEMEYQMRNWYYFNWLCGDHINEQHIHNLDVINWVKKGPPVSACGMGGRQVRTGIDNGEIYDHHSILFTYADGTVLHSECRHQPECWKSVTEHAHGTKGYCDISGHRTTPLQGGEGWHIKADRSEKIDPYQIEHDDLAKAIRENQPYNEAEYGAHSTMTSLLGRMASYSGQIVRWDDAINAQVSIMPEKFAWDATPPSVPNAEGRYSIPMPGEKGNDFVWQRVNAEIIGWAGGKRASANQAPMPKV
jgi:myo-inositol 2-dehydrogenase/D-chiro-inositol 1-dehydrogenase